jgi:hypothetical protein
MDGSAAIGKRGIVMRRWFKYWRVILALVSVFLAGGLMGFIGGATAAKRKIQQLNVPENWSSFILRKLDHELKLTEEQRQKIRPLLQSTAQDLSGVRRQAILSSMHHLKTLYGSLEPILTGEQKQKLAKAKEKLKQQYKESGEVRSLAPGGPLRRPFHPPAAPPGKAGGDPARQ